MSVVSGWGEPTMPKGKRTSMEKTKSNTAAKTTTTANAKTNGWTPVDAVRRIPYALPIHPFSPSSESRVDIGETYIH
jgi:hypothetical protein